MNPPNGDETSEWVEIAAAQSEIEAGLVIGRLTEAGIEARSVKSQAAPGAWLTGTEPTWAPANVFVPSDRVDEALAVLAEEAPESDEWADFEQDEPGIIAESRRRSGWYWVAIVVVVAMIAVLLQSELRFIDL